MKRFRTFVLCTIYCSFAVTACGGMPPPTQDNEVSNLVGDWTGESVCVNKDKFPACKDEHVVYHVSITAGKTNTVTIRADKIVNGKPEDMGAIDYVYDAEKRTLKGEFQNSRVHLSLEFVVKGNTLEGGMFLLPERIQARDIKVRKNGSDDGPERKP